MNAARLIVVFMLFASFRTACCRDYPAKYEIFDYVNQNRKHITVLQSSEYPPGKDVRGVDVNVDNAQVPAGALNVLPSVKYVKLTGDINHINPWLRLIQKSFPNLKYLFLKLKKEDMALLDLDFLPKLDQLNTRAGFINKL